VRKADNLPTSCAVVTQSGNLNFLEPSGPVTGLIYLFTCISVVCFEFVAWPLGSTRTAIIEWIPVSFSRIITVSVLVLAALLWCDLPLLKG